MIPMKEALKKVYPFLLPPACIIAGVISIVFYFVGPVGKGQWDILAIGIVCIAAAIFAIIVALINRHEEKKNK